MRAFRSILLILAIAGVVRSANADLRIPPPEQLLGIADSAAAIALLPAPVGSQSSAWSTDHLSWLDSSLGNGGEYAASAAMHAEEDPHAGGTGNAWQLPSAPGSSSLFISALLSGGAFHLARKARNAPFGYLPAWYHTACPERIGHTVAFDFDLTDMPVCFTAEMAAADVPDSVPAFHEYLRESRSRIEHQFVLPVIAPRGPPSRS